MYDMYDVYTILYGSNHNEENHTSFSLLLQMNYSARQKQGDVASPLWF